MGDQAGRPPVRVPARQPAFDRIDHNHLLGLLGSFPAREQIRAWLKAGVVDHNRYAPADEGTPQGGVISPLLLNITLQGIEEAAGTRYYKNGKLVPGTPAVIVYADDLVALCHSRQQAETVQERLTIWLAPKGLRFNQQKTRIGPITAGFDFLSFSIRRYQTKDGGKVQTRPSNEALTKIRRRMKAELRALRGTPAAAVIDRLNPVIRGQAAYYRTGASKRTFNALDHYMWRPLYAWALRQHRRKNRRWVKNHYFGRYNKARNDTWAFGDRKTGAYLRKYSWTPIVRHAPVAGRASPDDPALAQYWADRRQRHRRPAPPLAPSTQRARRDPPRGDHRAHRGGPDRRSPPPPHAHRLPPPPPRRRRSQDGTLKAEPASPRGPLQPGAATSGTPGCEGAGAQQCAPATRPLLCRGVRRHTMTHSGTPQRRPRRPGTPSSRGISAGHGRCCARTPPGEASGSPNR